MSNDEDNLQTISLEQTCKENGADDVATTDGEETEHAASNGGETISNKDSKAESVEEEKDQVHAPEVSGEVERRPSPENDAVCDKLQSRIKELEAEVMQRRMETELAEEKLKRHDDAAKRAIQALQQDLKVKLGDASRQVEESKREKESSVMRFAQAEQRVLEMKTSCEKLDSQLKSSFRERDQLNERMKAMLDEKKKLQTAYDQRLSELERSKELANTAEAAVKLAQQKAKAELDSAQEMRLKLEKAQQQYLATKDEFERFKRSISEKEEMQQIQREKAQQLLEMERLQQHMELAELNERLRSELAEIKRQHHDLMEEARTLRDRVTCLDSELTQVRELVETEQLGRKEAEQDAIAALREAETAREEAALARDRAAETVSHGQQLASLRSQLQSENSNLAESLADAKQEASRATAEYNRMKAQLDEVTAALEDEKRKHRQANDQSSTELEKLRRDMAEAEAKLSELDSSLQSTKRKHAREVKELQRQLKLATASPSKQGNQLTSSTSQPPSISRTSSHSSGLDVAASASSSALPQVPLPPQFDENHNADAGNHMAVMIEGGAQEVGRQQIIERIVSLQRTLARRNEKIDFLQEQVRELLNEVQKKSKIIQMYALREETGALRSEDMEKHKAAMARRTGVMASVLNSSGDGQITLDLALEISRKLQDVLEETLLKNITLKESLDTLGHEIAHLSKDNRDLKLNLKSVLETSAAVPRPQQPTAPPR